MIIKLYRPCFPVYLWAVLFIFVGGASYAQIEKPSPEMQEVVFGMSTVLSGSAASLGESVRYGVECALMEVNKSGGVQGRNLRLVCLDDGYEPENTIPNMIKLIQEENVLAIVGNVGTPTAVAAIPIATREKTLFYGAYTGAGILRTSPPNRYVINFRASYAEEVGQMIDALISELDLKPEEIAFFTQRDAYGDSGYFGGLEALKKHGLENEGAILHCCYDRNSVAVENGLADLLLHPIRPKAIIMVGTYEPCAKFILLAKEHGVNAIFLNVSFVGAEPLALNLNGKADGIIVTQVVPHFEANIPVVTQYRAVSRARNKNMPLNFGSLEGYISTTIMIKALRDIRGETNRENIVDALINLKEFDIGLGTPLYLDQAEHQASHHVWASIIRGEEVHPFDWADLKSLYEEVNNEE